MPPREGSITGHLESLIYAKSPATSLRRGERESSADLGAGRTLVEILRRTAPATLAFKLPINLQGLGKLIYLDTRVRLFCAKRTATASLFLGGQNKDLQADDTVWVDFRSSNRVSPYAQNSSQAPTWQDSEKYEGRARLAFTKMFDSEMDRRNTRLPDYTGTI